MARVSKTFSRYLKYLDSTVVIPYFNLSSLPPALQIVFLVMTEVRDFRNLLLGHSCSANCILCILKSIYYSLQQAKSIPKSITANLPVPQDSDFFNTFDSIFSLLLTSQNQDKASSYLIKLLFEKTCNCGVIEGRRLSQNPLIRVPVDKLVIPESPSKESFCIFERDRLLLNQVFKLGKTSALFRSSQRFIENFSSILQNLEKNRALCENEKCYIFSQKLEFEKTGKHLFFGFDYKAGDKFLFNSVQILSQLENPLKGSEELLFIDFIVFTDFKRNFLCLLKDFRWFRADESSISLIGKGGWEDLALFVLKSGSFPLIVSYSSDVDSEGFSNKNLQFSKYQLIFLEMLSYSIDFLGNNETLVSALFVNIGTFHCDRLEILKICKFCKKSKKIYEVCQCGFVESDWICSQCNFYNFSSTKVCSNCQIVRIWLDHDFFCRNCNLCSYGSSSCLYCPYTKCSKCHERLSAFISVFCTTCYRFTVGKSKCNMKKHEFKCRGCFYS